MEEKKITMPVSRLSYSSLVLLLRNPLIFKMQQILGVYEQKMSPTRLIGQAGHEALKAYYGGNENIAMPKDKTDARALAIQTGLELMTAYSDEYIDYGKTGSRESMLKTYHQAITFYFQEEPEYDQILLVEKKLESEVTTDDGDILPLPFTGIPDIVERKENGEVHIIDFKFVSAFTDYDTEDYVKIIQAEFLYHLLKATEGIKATKMIFREIKTSANKDTTVPQVRDWSIPLDHEPYKIIFYNIIKDVVKFLSNDPVFLPNLSDRMDGEHAGLIYAQGLINADMSDVEVMHKVRDVAFTSKKFLSSKLEKAENKNLLPEEKIKIRLAEFGIPVEPVGVIVGGTVTQYQFKISAGIRMMSIKKHKDDIALALETKGDIKILAPIPGTSLIGVEVENSEKAIITFNDSLLTKGTLTIPVGVDVHGEHVKLKLDEMPHLLIAGSTGSGKSVLINTIISALSKQMPSTKMKLILIDPKRVELSHFKDLPHIQNKKIIFEYEEALRALIKLVDEMEERYKLLESKKKKDIQAYNKSEKKQMPYIVVVIDEFADFIMRAKVEEKKRKKKSYNGKSLEWLQNHARENCIFISPKMTKDRVIERIEDFDRKDEINRSDANMELLMVRLAQMARAVGIHLIVATQRPSVDVITGLIKANFVTKIALTTSTAVDSNVILGSPGAEKLLQKGDMLVQSPKLKGLVRLQGYFYDDN